MATNNKTTASKEWFTEQRQEIDAATGDRLLRLEMLWAKTCVLHVLLGDSHQMALDAATLSQYARLRIDARKGA